MRREQVEGIITASTHGDGVGDYSPMRSHSPKGDKEIVVWQSILN